MKQQDTEFEALKRAFLDMVEVVLTYGSDELITATHNAVGEYWLACKNPPPSEEKAAAA